MDGKERKEGKKSKVSGSGTVDGWPWKVGIEQVLLLLLLSTRQARSIGIFPESRDCFPQTGRERKKGGRGKKKLGITGSMAQIQNSNRVLQRFVARDAAAGARRGCPCPAQRHDSPCNVLFSFFFYFFPTVSRKWQRLSFFLFFFPGFFLYFLLCVNSLDKDFRNIVLKIYIEHCAYKIV